MSNFKEILKSYIQKIPAFFSGLILGALLTGAFFIFKINEYIIQFKETIYPKITITETQNSSKKQNDKNTANKKKYKKSIIDEISPNDEQKDTILTNYTHIEPNVDTTQNIIQTSEAEQPSVLEEKIISEKEVKIIHLNNHTDTSFTKIAEIPSYIQDNSIKIIFKKTPFNNKGYYYEDNHLVLVGLQDIPYINIYEYKGELYFKYDKRAFKLPYTNNFQNLIELRDEFILAKMN